MAKKQITESTIYRAIEKAHGPPAWACFPQVANGTGSSCRRHADALAMSLWPSRGLMLRGFEIKTHRGDWVNEKKNPEKAEAIASYCDEWWLVTPPGLVGNPDIDLPPAWGLMVLGERQALKTVRKAKTMEPQPVSKTFMAAILRAAQKQVEGVTKDYIHRNDIEDRLEKARERGRAEGPVHVRHLESQLSKFQRVVQDFQDATGLELVSKHGWEADVKKIAAAYRLGLALIGEYGERLPDVILAFDRIRAALDDAEKDVNTLLNQPEG
jgi:hypothetical protein